MSEECCSSNRKTMIVACSGASNVGQISNQAAVELGREGFGKMFCLAAVGAHINNFVFSAQNVDNLVAIDGCPVGCAIRLLEHAEVPVFAYVVVQNLGIEKKADSLFEEGEVKNVKDAIREACKSNASRIVDSHGPCSCCA